MLRAYTRIMEKHRAIIERFGGIRGMAEKLGHKTHGTVSGWWTRRKIPVEQWPKIDAAAREHGIPFHMAELLPEAA